jgi:hypothetical protein
LHRFTETLKDRGENQKKKSFFAVRVQISTPPVANMTPSSTRNSRSSKALSVHLQIAQLPAACSIARVLNHSIDLYGPR